MKQIFKFKYPRLALLVLAILATYYLFAYTTLPLTLQELHISKYLIIFIGGLLFSFGFTTPFAVGIFLTTHPNSLLLAALFGGLGALASDMLIFSIIKLSLVDEFERLKKTRPFMALTLVIKNTLKERIRLYFLYACAGFIIASPLPDEIGITMLAGLTTIKPATLAKISFIMNTIGIFIILAIAQ